MAFNPVSDIRLSHLFWVFCDMLDWLLEKYFDFKCNLF
mgnify:CR=1 FL=1